MNESLQRWNAALPGDAEQQILPCNGSREWAKALVQRRPFAQESDLLATADVVWWTLQPEAWQEAFDSHPRIGEQHAKAASEKSLQWSAGEQGRLGDEQTLKASLAAANRVYEERFGRIFLICATGKSAAEMLATLHRRLASDPGTELREVAEQQRRITQLRLRKWLALPAAGCEDV